MHGFVELEGGEVDAVAKRFARTTGEPLEMGTPAPVCASCGKPWTAARKARHSIQLIPIHSPVPVIFVYRICGSCFHLYRHGGGQRNAVLASVERFMLGSEVQA